MSKPCDIAMLGAAFLAALSSFAHQNAFAQADLVFNADTTGPINLSDQSPTGSSAVVEAGVNITSTENTITFGANPWLLSNSGSIFADGGYGVFLEAGGTITNTVGGVIESNTSGIFVDEVPADIINAGEIRSADAPQVAIIQNAGVHLQAGGTLINEASGLITGNIHGVIAGEQAFDAFPFLRFPAGTTEITNYGAIQSEGAAVEFVGHGTLVNHAGAVIDGGSNGVQTGSSLFLDNNQDLTVENHGVIRGGSAGISFGYGISVTNTGTIEGGDFGVVFGRLPTELRNSGTITGLSGVAVQFDLESNQTEPGSGLPPQTLILETGSVLNGSAIAGGLRQDTLILEGMGTEDDDFVSFGSVVMRGTDWSLSGDVDADTLSVESGVLRLNGTSKARASILSGGALAGTGTIGSVTNLGQLGNPGTIETLMIDGDYSQGVDALISLDATPSGQSDVFAISGSASLFGGVVDVTTAGEGYALNTEYVFLTADGGIAGQFDSVVLNSAFLEPSLTYTPTTVRLTLTRTDILFSDLCRTENQCSTAQALDALGATASGLLSADEAGARIAMDAVSGSAYAGLVQADLALIRAHARGLAFRARQTAPNRPSGSWTIWGEGEVRRSKLRTETNGIGHSADGYKLTVGLDHQYSDVAMIGFAFAYEDSELDFNDATGRGSSDVFFLSAHARFGVDSYLLHGSITYGLNSTEVSRTLTPIGLGALWSGEFKQPTLSGQVQAAWPFSVPEMHSTITPFAGLEFAHFGGDSFSESVSSIPTLDISLGSTTQAAFSAGTDITIALGGGPNHRSRLIISPSAHVEFGDREVGARNRFQNQSAAPFTTTSVRADVLSGQISARYSFEGELGTLGLGYDGRFASQATDHRVKLEAWFPF